MALLVHARVYAFLCDDAFIAFRYARNWAQGHGLVFNPGFERVEGYTNFLWVALLALGERLGVPPEAAANPLSVLATVGLWGLVAWFAWRSRPRDVGPGWALVPLVLLAATRSVAVWTTSGLETRFFELLVVAAALRFAVELERPPRVRVASVLFALAALTRPDALSMGAAALVAGHGFHLATKRIRWRAAAFDLAAFTVIAGGHFLWRHAYYGAWLPNTYYAKAAGRAWWGMGGDYLGAFLLEYMAILWLPLVVLGVRHRIRSGSAQVPVVLGALILPHLLYIVSLGGDHFEYRPFDLYFPFLFLLAGDGVNFLVASRPHPARKLAVALAVAIVAAGLFWIPWRSHAQFPVKYTVGYPGSSHDAGPFLDPARDPVLKWPVLRTLAGAHRELLARVTSRLVGARQEEHRAFYGVVRDQAAILKALVASGTIPPDAHVAMSCVGVIPYETGLRTLDRFGLTDAVVARSPALPGWPMAHDKLATIDYAASIGVDFWAEDPVKSVLSLDDPRLGTLVDLARGSGEPVYFAEVAAGVLLGRFPLGVEHAAARFPKLSFRPCSDEAAVVALDARIRDAMRASVVPGSIDELRWRASDLASQGRAEEAIALLRGAEADDDFEVQMTLGILLVGEGRFDEAAGSFERAATLRPDHDQPFYSLGVTLAKAGRWEESLPPLLRAVDVAPRNAQARYALGAAALAVGRREIWEEQLRGLREIGSPTARRMADKLEGAEK